VVFFGRTSNGKSTAINALLGERILPTGIGHTTSCFLQVEGSSETEAFLLTEDSSERKSVESIAQLGNALCSEKLDSSAKVRIVWPKERCKMLDEEVILIDSPGIDVETDLDEWIDKFCLDSDVFVLVANSESTIMLTEKKFFHKVSERLSNPNIFIVHNRSDAFAGESMQNEVRSQHTERAIHFLVDELKVCTNRSEAEERIFFISAKEALQARIQEAKGLPPQISTEDFFPRYLEFQNFEREFTACLSQSAVQTKFAAHSRKGQQIVKDMSNVMAEVFTNAQATQRALTTSKKELWDRCDFTLKQLDLMTLEMKEKIQAITEDVEYKVGKAMSEEIRRLSVLVDEFNDPFHPDPLVLNVYKSRISHHIESGVGSNLKTRLSSDLQINIESHEQEMIERMTSLLPSERQQISRNILPRRESFEVLYHLHFDTLCADFQEDIRFKFSLGFTALMRRFMAAGSNKYYSRILMPDYLHFF
jgi:mitofusin